MTLKRTIGLLSTIVLLFNLISCTKKQEVEIYDMALRGFVEEKVDLSEDIYGIIGSSAEASFKVFRLQTNTTVEVLQTLDTDTKFQIHVTSDETDRKSTRLNSSHSV